MKEQGMKLVKEYSKFFMKEVRLKVVVENVRLQLKKDVIVVFFVYFREKVLILDFILFFFIWILVFLMLLILGYVEEMIRLVE